MLPDPGTAEARAHGCTCPDWPPPSAGRHWVAAECPLHWRLDYLVGVYLHPTDDTLRVFLRGGPVHDHDTDVMR